MTYNKGRYDKLKTRPRKFVDSSERNRLASNPNISREYAIPENRVLKACPRIFKGRSKGRLQYNSKAPRGKRFSRIQEEE